MPMSEDFRKAAEPIIRSLAAKFGTPFYLYWEEGIVRNFQRLMDAYKDIPGFQEFFAVKALPNVVIMQLLSSLGCGFDLSSPWELQLRKWAGIPIAKTYFSSNNTSRAAFLFTEEIGVEWLNLDDITLVPKVPDPFPEKISLRFNPGPERTGNFIIGDPAKAKYGHTLEQLIRSYKMCYDRGARKFGLHTMICSNELNVDYHVETVKMLLNLARRIWEYTSRLIRLDHINQGGGIGLPYRPEQTEFDIYQLATRSKALLDQFRINTGWAPKLFMECGRYITGPYGVLVTKVINQKHIYREYRGVDANTGADLLRAAIYDTAYHHITVLNGEGRPTEKVCVTGALCENNDYFATDRELPKMAEDDLLLIHDVGAHGQAMGNNYNGWPRHKELLLKPDGSVTLIRRDENFDDYIATQSIDNTNWKPIREF